LPPYVGSRGAQDQRTIGVAAVVGDGTPSKSNLETNAILGTSMAAVTANFQAGNCSSQLGRQVCDLSKVYDPTPCAYRVQYAIA
jgi:enolase